MSFRCSGRIVVRESQLLVGNGAGLNLIDASDPPHLAIFGDESGFDVARSIAVAAGGSLATVPDGRNGVHLVDVGNRRQCRDAVYTSGFD